MDSDKRIEEKEDNFFSSINSTLNVKRNYESMHFDYGWIDKFESAIPYIDNILRNPKKFIVNQEEIVKVEQARKTGVESVIHLTQHTNLIRSIEDNGDVIPSNILTINREETFDTYENRFIYTLIGNMINFYNERVGGGATNSYYVDKKDLSYKANTKIGSEDVKIDLTIHSLDKNETITKNSGAISLNERLQKIKMNLDAFTASDLYKSLAKAHVPKVRSPIRKTNLIAKNPNFQQANILWDFIQSYVNTDKKETLKKDFFDKGQIKGEYDNAFLMLYTTNKLISDINNGASIDTIMESMIDRLIENILDSNPDVSEDLLAKKFSSCIKRVKKSNEIKRDVVRRVIFDKMKNEVNDMSLICKLLEVDSDITK